MTSEATTSPATPSAIVASQTTTTAPLATQTTDTVTVTPAPKPGWTTSEFWAMWAVKIPGALLALGLVGPANAASRIVGAAMMVLSLLGYTWARTMVKTMAVLLIIAIIPSANAACAPSTRQVAVRDSLVAIDTASQAFVSYDALHQQDIVTKATTREEATTKLQAWREQRTVAIYTISSAYRAISLVATDDKQPIAILTSAVKLVQDTLSQIGVKL